MKNILIFPKSSRSTVLLVEDCIELRDIMVHYLLDRHPGLSIETASDGVEALDKIAQRAPVLLITNINMPRMNGITLLKTLYERGISLPTLATSGWWTRETLEKELALQGLVPDSAIEFLQKPFQFEDLRRLIDKLRQAQSQ
jgi:two-component system response regulator MprA